jgi:hypothetical protein
LPLCNRLAASDSGLDSDPINCLQSRDFGNLPTQLTVIRELTENARPVFEEGR